MVEGVDGLFHETFSAGVRAPPRRQRVKHRNSEHPTATQRRAARRGSDKAGAVAHQSVGFNARASFSGPQAVPGSLGARPNHRGVPWSIGHLWSGLRGAPRVPVPP